ncbi:MAG TPA: hypothetical protein PLW86_15160, partial [Rhodocyclaceae bacterium]|nr:hypothetical protein [Rhodocyclaceae bacterium]
EASVDRQIEMHQDNEAVPLKFPCTPAMIIQFIDAAPQGSHSFSVPDAFRQAVTKREPTTDTPTRVPAESQEQSEAAPSGSPEKAVPVVMHEDDDEQAEAETLEQEADADAEIAKLFNPVKVATLEAMFPDGGKWAGYAERAKRNGLHAARVKRSLFNPYIAAVWWVAQGQSGWKWERCLRVLAKNLPARSHEFKHLLTGEFD